MCVSPVLDEALSILDKDGNGSLNYKEFLSNLKSEFKKREVRHYAKGMNMTAKRDNSDMGLI